MEVNLLTIGRVRVTMDEAASKQLLAKRLDHFSINLDKSQKKKTTIEGTLGVDVSYFKPRAIKKYETDVLCYELQLEKVKLPFVKLCHVSRKSF